MVMMIMQHQKKMKKKIFNSMKNLFEVSNNAGYGADGGEPDTGWLPGGDARTLGFESGKAEPWYEQLEFEQVDFPVASFIFGSKAEDRKRTALVSKRIPVSNLKDTLKSMNVEIEELRKNTESMYREV